MRYRETQCSVAPVSKDGAATMVRDAAHEVAKIGGSKFTAPHHEAGRGCECIKLIGNRSRLVQRPFS